MKLGSCIPVCFVSMWPHSGNVCVHIHKDTQTCINACACAHIRREKNLAYIYLKVML